MSLSQPEWDAFKALIDEPNAHKELECQPYLKHAAGLLLPHPATQITNVMEDRSYFGRTDLVIAADLLDGTNHTARHAYIFELKAPQCRLFQADTRNRCKPTKEFLEAENQLLHYFHEAAGNGRFRQRFDIMDEDNIHIGGIIIGTQERLVKSGGDFAKARTALSVRKKYLYAKSSIEVFTWDRVADFLRPPVAKAAEERGTEAKKGASPA